MTVETLPTLSDTRPVARGEVPTEQLYLVQGEVTDFTKGEVLDGEVWVCVYWSRKKEILLDV